MDALIQQNSLLISLLAGNLVQRPVRNGLHHQPRSLVSFASSAVRFNGRAAVGSGGQGTPLASNVSSNLVDAGVGVQFS
jgi:hypothetical protein